MPIFTDTIPLSLYIHLPWCVQKCPYCDFNSHALKGNLPEALYVSALLQELEDNLPYIDDRPLHTIFFGGGTPSLFSPSAIANILQGIRARTLISPQIEITMEANPGTIDQVRFEGFRAAGINRLSLGIQSLQDEKLKRLGRIHNSAEALRAIPLAKAAGFSNINVDLMFGLPDQTTEEACHDLTYALDEQPTHLSWYQLTLEPNTLFYQQPPPLPDEETILDMQKKGQDLLRAAGFMQYEVSAYAHSSQTCAHNLNYWQYGDYLGIGAGAHSKITHGEKIMRAAQIKHPRDYLDLQKRKPLAWREIKAEDIIFEFMLNALRLSDGFEKKLFAARTGLDIEIIAPILMRAKQRKLLHEDAEKITPTVLGQQFLNDLVSLFLPY